jgi:hypothetical protein
MIADRADLDEDGVPENLIRYPGALVKSDTSPTRHSVEIPLVVGRGANGVETIRWVKVVEEIKRNNKSVFPIADATTPDAPNSEDLQGIVALRINYPFQSAAMSSFRQAPGGIFDANLSLVNVANDIDVTPVDPDDPANPETVVSAPIKGMTYPGTYAGPYGLGVQGALGSNAMTGGLPVRPFRRVITTQAIFRREVFWRPPPQQPTQPNLPGP